jgi:hypothetical protein
MDIYSAAKMICMKRFLLGALFVLPLVLGGCIAKTHMIAHESKPVIKPKSDKAILVIIRTTAFGGGNVVDNYLDGKMIGQTQGKVFFITEVKPGVHYVMSHADNTDTARLNFTAGKIYLLEQGIYPGWNITTRYSPMTPWEFAEQVQEANYVVYDTKNPGKDMLDKDFKEAKENFEKEVKQSEHIDTLQIKGYSKLE